VLKIERGRMPAWLESADPKLDACKRCADKIFWGKTRNGKNIPLNVPSKTDDENSELYVSHFATCSFAEEFRKDQ